jgi:hypothetical protein
VVDVIKKSGVREAAEDINVGSDFYEELERRARELIERAVNEHKRTDARPSRLGTHKPVKRLTLSPGRVSLLFVHLASSPNARIP